MSSLRWFAVSTACLAVFGVPAQTHSFQRANDDKARIQGTWELVSQLENGEETIKDRKEKFYYIFDGDKLRTKGGAIQVNATFRLDPKNSPKTLDIRELDGNKNTILGIYELKLDQLRICTPDSSEIQIARPKKFVSTKVYALLVFKRVKK